MILDTLNNILDSFEEEICKVKDKVVKEIVISANYETSICWNDKWQLTDRLPEYCLEHVKELYNKK